MVTSSVMPLGARAEAALARFGDHPTLCFEGQWFSSYELAGRARRAASGFTQLRVGPGDRVVVVMANCPEVILTYAALWRVGAVPTPALFLLTEDELRHVIADSGAVAVVTTPEFLSKVRAAAPALPIVLVGGDNSGAEPSLSVGASGRSPVVPWEELESGDEMALVSGDVSDLAALLYTGGTTGRSKGVALTHAGLDAAGRAAADAAASPGRNSLVVPLPLAHAYGLLVSVVGLHVHEPHRIFLMRWFDPAAWLRLVAEDRIQSGALVPSMLQMLLGQPLESYDLGCLERVASGAAPLAVEVLREFERRVPSCLIREGYGCTEASALISGQPPEGRKVGSVGKPLAGIEVRIELPNGTDALPGQDGEICVAGATLMHGYWKDPQGTDAALVDGWLHTGDVGHLDEDGWLYVVDRLKDLIIRGGFNVYPRDVEEVLLSHPAVAAAAVVGRPDARLGEEVVAFVQLASEATPEELVEFSRERLGSHKYPRELRFVESVPLTSVGKTDRKALRALL